MGVSFKNIFAVLVFILMFSGLGKAQSSPKPYYYEGKWVEDIVVDKGRTIYNLTKTYNLTEKELFDLNPELKQGLKAGMTIRVPSLKPESDNTGKTTVPKLAGALKHTVKKKETIYGIAKMYGVEIDDIYALNPQANQGISPGMELTIYPKPSSAPPTSKEITARDTTPADSVNLSKRKPVKCDDLDDIKKKRPIHLSLLLPFYLPPEDELNPKSRIGLDFFAGARIATDSLRKAGYSVDIHVFDTQNDSATVNRVLNNSAFASSDLIIGPLYSQAFVMVAEKARELGIPAVTPFSQSDALIEGYPNVIKVTPSSEQQMKEYAPALAQQFAVAKFILIQTDLSKDKSLCNQFKQAWAGINNAPELNEISFADFRTNQGILDAVKQNIVIFPSSDEVKLIELSNRLYKLSDSYRIRLAGLNEWNSFDNVDFDILNKLQFVYASPLQQDFGS
ncbi:MAG: LysM peptidoglycan-binding domain-containing protein [Bacteroidia bacterium]